MIKQVPPDSQSPEGWPVCSLSRSKLFGVTPYGFNGATREHIVSLFRRTSNAQALLPRSLAFHVIVPPMGIPTLVSADFIADKCYRLNLCGMGASSSRWVDLLNQLTSRTNLQSLTLSSFRNLVSSYQLIESANRFCPACYAEDERAGRDKYDRLLWAIRCVTACPVHERRLILEPQFKGRRPFPFTVPGISRIDGSSLANFTSDLASKYEVDVAQMVSELIDDLEIEPQKISLTATFLNHVANHLFDGNSAALAGHLGLSKSQVHGWMHGGILASLSCVTRIAYAFNCSISDVISGYTDSPRLHHGSEFPRGLFGLARRSGYQMPRKKILASLSAFMKDNPDSNAKDAASHFDVSPRFLRDNFPEQNKALVTAGRLHTQRIAQARQDAKDQAYERLYLALKNSGTYPSRRKVAKQLKEQGISLSFADERRAQKSVETARWTLSSFRTTDRQGSPDHAANC
ncbi:TniQ family protein [Paraburkholderia sp. 35.1]|uniref:TniQ family protein n=1 Tax=Paraburkholderia sp. 35.1 TaxID=2991058 RepID=UPI003D1ED90E